ncbi:MAG TPA: methyltransferase, partial [Thermoanaerobaculia bacterium]|nr:methyltransferase [Thermoanaerobaculia bacterium]
HRAGDLTSADLGGGWDVALLFNILHHFKPQPIQEILARVFSALSPAGTAAIWEIEVPEADSKPTDGDGAALFFRLTSTAACYRAAEYQAWLQDAGFRRVRVVRPLTTPGNVLVIGQKA